MTTHIGGDATLDKSLTVNGGTNLNSGLTVTGSVTVNGGVTSTAPMNAPAFNQTSDYRLKEKISPVSNTIHLLMSLKPYKYMIDQKWSFGLIAHELQEVIPEAVTGEKDGPFYQKVDYIQLIPHLIAAIQEQQKEIQALKEKINEHTN